MNRFRCQALGGTPEEEIKNLLLFRLSTMGWARPTTARADRRGGGEHGERDGRRDGDGERRRRDHSIEAKVSGRERSQLECRTCGF